jgi:glycosyltransferase involved in cell wall biosynthesis
MKISIITVSFNSESTIRHTIESVLNQNYSNIEYIIIDGGSKDKTISIVKEYESRINKFISEKDEGIYDAFNKGISFATGDVIGIINSDDTYFSNDIISKIAKNFNNHNIDSLYGDLVYINNVESNNYVRYWKSSSFTNNSFISGFHPPHPTFFVKRTVYEKYGCFDTTIKISSDFDLMLRFLEVNKISTLYLNEPLVKMLIGGESGKNFKNIYIGNKSIYKSFRKYNIKINPVIYFIKRFTFKISQHLVKFKA